VRDRDRAGDLVGGIDIQRPVLDELEQQPESVTR